MLSKEVVYNEKQLEAINSNASRIVVEAPPGSGKALKAGTKVLGEFGWVNIEDVKIGDKIYGQDGILASVLGVYPQGKKQIYKVTFNDGNIIECCKEHLWAYQTSDAHRQHSNKWSVRSTKELLENVPLFLQESCYKRKNVYLPMTKPIQFTDNSSLLIPPYTMGALLGDGCLRKTGQRCIFTNTDDDIVERVNGELSTIGSHLKHIELYQYIITTEAIGKASLFRKYLRYYDLEKKSEDKFIPKDYLYASVQQRLELLQGLVDTDGYVERSAYEFYTVSKQLAEDVTFLCESLGFLVRRTIKNSLYVDEDGERIKCKDCYRLRIKTSAEYPKIHWCSRKDKMWRPAQSYAHRNIISIEPTQEYAEMTCIEVDNDSHLYLTEHCIVTHNTKSLVGAALKYKKEHPKDKVIAITFTRKAAAELQFKTLSENISCATIHSWSLKELNRLGVKYGVKISILQDIQIQEIIKKISESYGYYSLNQFLLFSYVMGNYNIDIPLKAKGKFERVSRGYIEYKRANRLYDFTDLPLYLYDVLEMFNDVIDNVDALFVDEFQDVDPVQAQIFEKVQAKKFFYIGDPEQTIYQFRDCSAENLKNLIGFEKHTLDINYRSYQGIIDYANSIQKAKGTSLSSIDFLTKNHITASRTDLLGNVFIVRNILSTFNIITNDESPTFAVLSAFLLQRPQILCRTNKQVKAINSLGYKNVSTIHQAKGLEYPNVLVVDMELENEEEINIAYVACTRAENSLMICGFDIVKNQLEDMMIEYREELTGGKLF